MQMVLSEYDVSEVQRYYYGLMNLLQQQIHALSYLIIFLFPYSPYSLSKKILDHGLSLYMTKVKGAHYN